MKNNRILKTSIVCPGPCVKKKRSFNCGKEMELKLTNDNKDKYMWHCRKVHTVITGDKKYKCKDVKLSIRHESWLVDTKLQLEIILEMIYLWLQSFSPLEIVHELKLTKKTVIEWSTFFCEACITSLWIKARLLVAMESKLKVTKVNSGRGSITEDTELKGNGYLAHVKSMTSQRYLWYLFPTGKQQHWKQLSNSGLNPEQLFTAIAGKVTQSWQKWDTHI